MNPLTHAFIALSLFKDEKLTKDEKDHLLLGCIIPDLHLSELITYKETHYRALEFFKSTTNRLHQFLALGMVLHGEEPKGVDYYAHGKEGIIEQNQEEINKIALKYKSCIGNFNAMTAHFLIEFSCDSIISQRDKSILPQFLSALDNPKLDQAITEFSNFFGLEKKKKEKIIRLFHNRFLKKFFENLSSIETTPKSWTNVTFVMNPKNENTRLSFREKLTIFTKFSYLNLQRKIHHIKIAQLFEEINAQMEQPALEFIYQTIEKLKPLKNDLQRNLC
mgnify:CR=1 FL=1